MPMRSRRRTAGSGPAKAALVTLAVGLVLSGCTTGTPQAVPGIAPVAPVAPGHAVAPPKVPVAAPSVPKASAPAAVTGKSAAPLLPVLSATPAPPQDTRTGTQLDQPYTVDGVVVVSNDHMISANYKPAVQVAPGNVTPETAAAIKNLQAAARADGLTALVRSGYRSYATQQQMIIAKARNYPNTAAEMRYIAKAGASEHQTGLAVDFWDGRNWGNTIGNTPLMKWLAVHAREFGFIQRYPDGKENVTGFAYEAWHYRYVGTAISLKFKPDTSETLEEYLGLA